MGAGTSQAFGNEFSNVFAVTDIVLQNPTGDIGSVQISRDARVLMTSALENFRDLDLHFVAPYMFRPGRVADHDDHLHDARSGLAGMHDVGVVRRLRHVSRRRSRRDHSRRCALAALVFATTTVWTGDSSTFAAAPAELISVSLTGTGPLITQDQMPSVSGDGNIVVFTGYPPPGTEFGTNQVFVRNRAAATTSAVPPGFNVTEATGGVVSRDGCHVAYWGYFAGFSFPPFFIIPPNWDVYTWDRCTMGAAPVVVSTASDFPALTAGGSERGPLAISSDGRYVAYLAQEPNQSPRVARIDTAGPVEHRLGVFVTDARTIDISDDGAFIAMGVRAVYNDINRDVVIGWTPPCLSGTVLVCNTELISVASDGDPAIGFSDDPSVSADGRYVAFTSTSPDIVGLPATTAPQVYVRDRATRTNRLVTSTPPTVMPGALGAPEISPDGTQIALTQSGIAGISAAAPAQVLVARSVSGFFDSAVFDLVSFGVNDLPVTTGAGQPSMSSNGRYVAFVSAANTELSGSAMANGLEVWMRQRPIALDITPTVDFGTVLVGAQSAPQNAVVRNTSGVAINISQVTPPAAPFTITANGCGGSLAPGASCVVTMVFQPTADGGASSSLTVGGDGLSVSSSLVGVGQSPTPTPVPGSLTITPGSANYGSATVGSSVGARNFTVSNPGETAVPLAGIGISGGGADQFAITANSCGPSVAGGASCVVSVGATLTRVGALSATLGAVGTGGQSAQAILRIRGDAPELELFTPVLKMNPGVVRPGQVTTAVGSAFPPDIDVQLTYADATPIATVHTDGDGAFTFDLLILRNGVVIGGREVIAVDQPQFSGVRAPLLIDLATYRPSGFISPAITNGVRSFVARSG